jgi:hypothetical protein
MAAKRVNPGETVALRISAAINDHAGLIDGRAAGPASATDNAAARFDGATGKLLQNSALLIADTTGALSRSGDGGIPVQGTNTNDSAAAGFVGEVISSTVLTGSGILLTTATPANVTSISLTAGDWDVYHLAYFNPAGATNMTLWFASIALVSATLDVTPGRYILTRYPGGSVIGGDFGGYMVGDQLSISATTTVYMVVRADFTVSTCRAFGKIYARRRR